MDLTALINTYRGPLIGLIASWGAPWGDAVEIAQDSFAAAWLNRESCRGDWNQADVFGRWLRGVALNEYRNWARSRRGGETAWSRSNRPYSNRPRRRRIPRLPKTWTPCGRPSGDCPPGSVRWC